MRAVGARLFLYGGCPSLYRFRAFGPASQGLGDGVWQFLEPFDRGREATWATS